MRTLLVTGGAGFIGSCFIRMLLAEGKAKVVNLDKLTYAGNLESLPGAERNPHYQFVQGDIGDPELGAKLFAEHRPEGVVNFAAERHVDILQLVVKEVQDVGF